MQRRLAWSLPKDDMREKRNDGMFLSNPNFFLIEKGHEKLSRVMEMFYVLFGVVLSW